MCGHTCCSEYVEARGQFCGSNSLLPLLGMKLSSPGLQRKDLSHWPILSTLFFFFLNSGEILGPCVTHHFFTPLWCPVLLFLLTSINTFLFSVFPRISFLGFNLLFMSTQRIFEIYINYESDKNRRHIGPSSLGNSRHIGPTQLHSDWDVLPFTCVSYLLGMWVRALIF